MKKSIDKFSFEKKIKTTVYFDKSHFIILNDDVRTESIAVPILDDKGNETFSLDDEGNKIPKMHFIQKKICRPYAVNVELNELQLAKFDSKNENISDKDFQKTIEPYILD